MSPPTLYRPMDLRGEAHAVPRPRPDLGQGRAGRPRPRRLARRGRRDAPAPADDDPGRASAISSPARRPIVTVAAVDLGILNLTNFEPPAPDDWYFGQRKLGMEIRDLYGLLIDRMQGVPGDGALRRRRRRRRGLPHRRRPRSWSPSTPASSRSDPTARRRSPSTCREFNGTVRVMAMAWSRAGVGHAVKDVLVRDPVVRQRQHPAVPAHRRHARGSSSRSTTSRARPATTASRSRPATASASPPSDRERTVTLAEKERQSFNIPISGETVGDYDVTVTPDHARRARPGRRSLPSASARPASR